MAGSDEAENRKLLERVARSAMLERGLLPDYPLGVLEELEGIRAPVSLPADGLRDFRDLRDLSWCSIDNDDSKDLDQLSVARAASGRALDTVLVAVADVERFVRSGGALDTHAIRNTSTVYTPAKNFSMLPERLSTDLSSLNFGQDRMALVVEMGIAADGSVDSSTVYGAIVKNRARLSYQPVAAWLEGGGAPPQELRTVPGLAENLRLQDSLSSRMEARRLARGALEFESRTERPGFDEGGTLRFESSAKNRATQLIENFMIAANAAMVAFLHERGYPGFCRIVRAPKR
jgi:ribonuclease R